MGKAKDRELCPRRNPRGDRGFRELLRFYTLYRMSPWDKGGEKF